MRNKVTITLLSLFTFYLTGLVGQGNVPVNDECITSIFIPNVDSFCSKGLEFTNEGATKSPEGRPSCWPQDTEDADVWFSFRPKNLAVLVQLTGQTVTKEGTLITPSMSIYSGRCGALSEVGCGSVLFEENVVELTIDDLIIGGLYYIRIDGRAKAVGKFKLCINTFTPLRKPEADCVRGIVLCDKEEIFINDLVGSGQVDTEVDPRSCLEEEFASVWYKWTCKDAGNLTFTITPNNKPDDIDFALYRLPGGLDDCANKQLIRCMASGETIGNSPGLNSPCFGATGIRPSSNDEVETPGCQPGDDNYVRDIQMRPGESYVLLINNFSESGYGFSIKWGGTATFLGPEPDFKATTLDRFECDKNVIFTNASRSLTDSITSYRWSFGDGANPIRSNAKNNVDVIYSSFGNKTAALTVQTLRGCTVTKIVDFYINPCCKDTSTIGIAARTKDVTCLNLSNGIIDAISLGGAGGFEFSLDSITFQPTNRFSSLAKGNYNVFIRDQKGCTNKTRVRIGDPPPIKVNAGNDIEVLLGCEIEFNGSASGGTGFLRPKWIPSDYIINDSVFKTSFIPIKSKGYLLKVIDENGCVSSDSIFVKVIPERDIYTPNIIKRGAMNINNEFFSLNGSEKSVTQIGYLRIYDRWGNMMFEKKNFKINDFKEGWNGLFNGENIQDGVYTWVAKIEYLDEVEKVYSGDVTVLR
jgi:PKD repeat protein